MKRLVSSEKLAELDIKNLEKQYNHLIEKDKLDNSKYYELPDAEDNENRRTFLLNPIATLEQWNQDPIDYHAPHPGHDGFYAYSTSWIGR